VIREDRIPAQEFLSDPDYLDMPDPAEITTALGRTMSLDQPVAALEIARCFFPEMDPDHPDFDQTLSADPAALDWRVALGARPEGACRCSTRSDHHRRDKRTFDAWVNSGRVQRVKAVSGLG